MKAKRKFNMGGERAVKPFLRRSNVVSSSPKTIIAVVLLSSLLIISCKSSSNNKDTEAVAKVGSREISMKQVDSLIKQQLDASGGGTFSSAELVAARLNVLDNLIQEEALFQRAQKDNLVPDDNKVNQEIQKRKQDANLTEDQYQAQLKQQGMTEEEVREQIRRQLAINQLRDAQRARVSQPTDAEIEKYYTEHQSEFRAERGVDISVIAIDPASNGLPSDDAIGNDMAEQKARSIYEQLKSGSDFATVAQRSEDPNTAMRGGAVGFRTEDQLKQMFPTRPEVPQRLMSMSAGQFTEPLKDNVSNALFIIKVNQKLEQARNLTLNDMRATIINTITQQRQGLLLNALVLLAVNEAGVKNYLAERIVENPQTIVEMRPSQLLQSANSNSQPQQPQPRFENQNQSTPAATNSNRAASSNANSNSRPSASSNANR